MSSFPTTLHANLDPLRPGSSNLTHHISSSSRAHLRLFKNPQSTNFQHVCSEKIFPSRLQYRRRHAFCDDPKEGTFELFSQLPNELRLLIWAAAARTPIVIGLRPGQDPQFLKSTSLRCPLYNVSKEARDEVVKIKKNFYPTSNFPQLLTNPSSDILYLDNTDFRLEQLSAANTRLLKNIRTIAVDYREWHKTYDYEPSMSEIVQSRQSGKAYLEYLLQRTVTPSLEKVLIVVNKPTLKPYEQPIFIEPRQTPWELGLPQISGGSGLLKNETWQWRAAADAQIRQERRDNKLRTLFSILNLSIFLLATQIWRGEIERFCEKLPTGNPLLLNTPSVRFVEAVTTRDI
ncbi:hypothetical protein G7Y89_g2924 [Cudoniella acicularis]|uniref:2EXR domain-containing protein n=1 Tax=Cudoniella acicularis TaxID=354080 RepID=A0A8H4RSF0_9HELO|nr:hypothetical protein G7Y89_g2924 [Cudoniella acicularis]